MVVSLNRCDPGFKTVWRGMKVEHDHKELAHRRFSNIGESKPCRISHPFILRSSPPVGSVMNVRNVGAGAEYQRKVYLCPSNSTPISMVRDHARANSLQHSRARPVAGEARESHLIGTQSEIQTSGSSKQKEGLEIGQRISYLLGRRRLSQSNDRQRVFSEPQGIL